MEVERRLDGTLWVRFRGSYLSLRPGPSPPPATPFGLRPTGLAEQRNPKLKRKYIPPPRSPVAADIFIGQKMGHFYIALTEATKHLDKAALPVRLVEQLRFTLWTTRLLSTPQFPGKVKSSALQTAVYFGPTELRPPIHRQPSSA